MRPILIGDVISIKGKDSELKGVVTELTDNKYVKVQPFFMQCDLYVERKIIVQDNEELYGSYKEDLNEFLDQARIEAKIKQ